MLHHTQTTISPRNLSVQVFGSNTNSGDPSAPSDDAAAQQEREKAAAEDDKLLADVEAMGARL